MLNSASDKNVNSSITFSAPHVSAVTGKRNCLVQIYHVRNKAGFLELAYRRPTMRRTAHLT